ncbi:DUF6266 family protein [Pseudopedobacter beijingensis]|uniref:DUF6266 family protein n=1 Tax=Pseudopedobacter beijingensis TaxID=1207056 RepID=A0ABW4IB80_9SPHI
MGFYKKGANGNVLGKFGSVIGSRWRGKHYLKGLPERSSKGPSEDQIAHRAKFAMCSKYLQPIKEILNVGYRDKTMKRMSAYNLASRLLLNECITGEYPNYIVDFSIMKLSAGSLVVLQNAVAVQTGSSLDITWMGLYNGINCFKDDMVFVVLYSETKDYYLPYLDGIREDLSYSVDISGFEVGEKYHVWVFCSSRNNLAVSNTQYLGAFEKA